NEVEPSVDRLSEKREGAAVARKDIGNLTDVGTVVAPKFHASDSVIGCKVKRVVEDGPHIIAGAGAAGVKINDACGIRAIIFPKLEAGHAIAGVEIKGIVKDR